MKKTFFLVGVLCCFVLPTYASVSSVDEMSSTNPVVTETTYMDYDSMAGKPYYPNILYPTLSQEAMLRAAYEVERKDVATAYGEETAIRLDAVINRLIQKATTVAKTREGQAMFLGEYISKIQMAQGIYNYSSNPIIHVINYIGYALSVKTLDILYSGMNGNIDEIISWIENK